MDYIEKEFRLSLISLGYDDYHAMTMPIEEVRAVLFDHVQWLESLIQMQTECWWKKQYEELLKDSKRIERFADSCHQELLDQIRH